MIIANDVLNKMDADELRNYVAHLHEEIHMMHELCYARSELIETLERAYRCKDYELNRTAQLNAASGRTAEVGHELELKYEYAMKRPVCEKRDNTAVAK